MFSVYPLWALSPFSCMWHLRHRQTAGNTDCSDMNLSSILRISGSFVSSAFSMMFLISRHRFRSISSLLSFSGSRSFRLVHHRNSSLGVLCILGIRLCLLESSVSQYHCRVLKMVFRLFCRIRIHKIWEPMICLVWPLSWGSSSWCFRTVIFEGVSVSWANSGGYHIIPRTEAAVDELKEKDFLSAS